ncbi:ATP-binding protein [Actinoplanes sp. NPDC020271]|uniref:ATP-binding protein n=1 Tax=Actinoplanes sp. NPDC020271 TaxID=3363896 RepID=UPI00379B0F55
MGDGAPRLAILGPLRVWRDGAELDPGPRQQVLLLGLLLARAGQPVSVGELIDLIWGEAAPATAGNVIQKHISILRRLLEPELPARDTGSYLRLHGNGYRFAADRDGLDLVAFRELVQAAAAALARHQREAALDSYVEALRLWRGPAGDAVDAGPAARAVFAALDQEFFTACTAATELAVTLGRSSRVLSPLRLAASMAPLHEPLQAALISALAAAGHRAEAMSLAGAVQERLVSELGIDPGPALQTAYRQLFGPASAEATGGARPERGMVGRAEELAVVRRGIDWAFAGGTGLVVVEGEPGVGKTRLLEEAAAEAEGRGAFVVWGHCLEGDGTPSMWPWVEVVGAILASLPGDAQGEWLAGELGRLLARGDAALDTPLQADSGAQFRLFERMVDLVARAASQRRLVLIVDDLQWADLASLHLFGHLAARLPAGVTLIGALRSHAPVPSSDLTRTLAGASRLAGHRRVLLGPLDAGEVTELVRRETGRAPTATASQGIRARTGGNPFFIRELARLLMAGGGEVSEEAAVRAGVPATVRDVVRDRMTGLDDSTRGLLQVAALVGREAEVSLLATVAEIDVPACLRRLEPAEALGLLGPAPGNPFSLRFSHDLIRESIARSTPPRWAPRMHLRVADALERTGIEGESVAERLAHHLWAAGPLADPARTASALLRAGRRAAAKAAFDVAERHLRSAVRVARPASLAETELAALSQLTMVLGMQAGYVGAPPDILERSEELALGLGRELEATTFLFTRWTGYSQGLQVDLSGRLAQRLRRQGEASADPVVRAYGWLAWGVHQWEIGAIGEALRFLTRAVRVTPEGAVRRTDAPLLRDLGLLSAGMLGMVTTLHGDVAEARKLYDVMESDAGDDPYAVTFGATFAAISAAVAGDPEWALAAAKRGIAVDPDLTFGFLGTYQRLARLWALAMTGTDPGGAAGELRQMVESRLLDPPRSSIVSWYGALAEMYLAAGSLDEAGAALDRAQEALDRYGQRYAEGLILLVRARLAQARGEPAEVVLAAAERARALSAEREAYLFVHRAEEFVRRRA